MNRFLAGLALGALIFAGAVGAKVVYVTNPMSADLAGNGYSIHTEGGNIDLGSGQLTSLSGSVTINAADSIDISTSGDAGTSATAAGNAQVFAGGAINNTLKLGTYTNENVIRIENADANGAVRVRMTTLPTNDPGVSGQIWNDAGTLKISAG